VRGMRKKCSLLIALLPLAIIVILGVLAMVPPRAGITKANFDRIEKGMTRAEVAEILGREPDAVGDEIVGRHPDATRPHRDLMWRDGDGGWRVLVSFKDDLVHGTGWYVGVDDQSLVERFQHLIHWPWWK